ncbi:MAG: TetR/AcrR family transcriptional regulator [Alkalispirochaeta sp.]
MEPQEFTERQTRILDRAEELFFRKGFRRVTADEIADALGISKKTLYQDFRGKSELVRAVVRRKMAQLKATLTRHLETSDAAQTSGSERRSGDVAPLMGHFRLLAGELRSLGSEFLSDVMKYDGELWAEVNAFRREHIFTRLQRRIEEEQVAGTVRRDVSPRIVTTMLIAFAENLLTPENVVALDITPSAMVEQIGSIVIRGIST